MVTNVSSVMSVITCLEITNWGEIFLSAFPLEALTWANNHFHKSNVKAADQFKKLVRLCVDWCNQQGTKPAWAAMYQQQRLQGQPTDAQMYVQGPPKATEAVGGKRSATSHPLRTSPPLSENEVLISGTKYRVLSATEIEMRQAAFMNNTDCIAGVDKLSLLIGKRSATDYVGKVFDNLKYEEATE